MTNPLKYKHPKEHSRKEIALRMLAGTITLVCMLVWQEELRGLWWL